MTVYLNLNLSRVREDDDIRDQFARNFFPFIILGYGYRSPGPSHMTCPHSPLALVVVCAPSLSLSLSLSSPCSVACALRPCSRCFIAGMCAFFFSFQNIMKVIFPIYCTAYMPTDHTLTLSPSTPTFPIGPIGRALFLPTCSFA